MTEDQNNTKHLKFHSKQAIGIATFIGGPLAAGYLVRENYLSLNKPEEAKKSLWIGILATVILFGGIYMISESTMDKVPNQILPIIYTGIILFIVEKIHGKILNLHKENGNEFYSAWKAAGIGFIALLILLMVIFGYAFGSTSGEAFNKYDVQLEQFSKNETESLVLYEHLNTASHNSILQELKDITIPKWEENITIIKTSNTIENLPSELLEQNKILLKYSELRLKGFQLLKKGISEDTDIYDQQLNLIHTEIDEQLKKLN